MTKTGLIMEGGAMRGMFTSGVIDVFMEHDITFDGAIGVSAGAAFGVNLKSKQIGRGIRYNKKYCRDWRYCSVRSWLTTGDLYGGEFDYVELPSKLDPWDREEFTKNPMEFWCVATEAVEGKAMYHKCMTGNHNDLKWIQASASMPLASKAVQIDGKDMLDGGISDSVPLKYFQSIGYDRCTVILTQPADYRKEPYSKGMQAVMKTSLRKYPGTLDKLMHRADAYNKNIASICRQEAEGSVFVIRPSESLNIGSVCHDPDELQRVYNMGRKAGLESLWNLKEFLKK